MSIGRILAILYQYFCITRRSLEILLDIFWFSIITIIAFGFVSVFLTGKIDSVQAHYLILGMLLWEVMRLAQYTLSIGALWNVWSRNLSNLFITPLLIREYVIAYMLAGVIKSLFVFGLTSVIAAVAFDFNVLRLGNLNLILFLTNLLIFAWVIGLVLLGLVFRFGTRLQALAWSTIFLFQPLTAAFFPLEILPNALQTIARLFPPTYVFEAAREALSNPSINWSFFAIAFCENIIYLAFSALILKRLFIKSKQTGQFARNDT